jgi:3-vinyl bacteriochlorophyllide hydratase
LARRQDERQDKKPLALYTAEQRRKRDQTGWTLVQGILAPVQFVVFAVSLYLVVRYLMTGLGYEAATWSIIAKTMALYLIMVTGALWENAVFGRYLFAPAFFWEDAVSFIVIALHTAYLFALLTDTLSPTQLMVLALVAYFTYVINAGQFLLKLRAARLEAPRGVEMTSEGLEMAP